jgi:type IV pilus assembly protein PilV
MIDRMRANRQAALNGAYDGDFVSPAPACGSVVAGGATVAAVDIAAWRNALACSLPAGTGFVDVAADGVTTVRVRWDESRAEQSAATVLETLDMTTVL